MDSHLAVSNLSSSASVQNGTDGPEAAAVVSGSRSARKVEAAAGPRHGLLLPRRGDKMLAMALNSTLFISYRRDTGGGHAGRLADSLARLVGRHTVFLDERHIDPGRPFPPALTAAVENSLGVLVVIAPGWSTAADSRGLRLDRPDDWVRREIETAFASRKLVVPVLVGRAPMPPPDELPLSLRALAELQAVDLRDATWDADVERLVTSLGVRRLPGAGSKTVLAALSVAVLVAAGVFGVGWLSPQGAGVVDPFRLTTLDPTPDQLEAVASRHAAAGVSVPVLRYFIAQARVAQIPDSRLPDELERFAERMNALGFTDEASLGGHAGGTTTEEGEAIRRALRMARSGDMDAALHELPPLPLAPATSARRPDNPERRAILHYKTGQLQALRGERREALKLLDAAVAAMPRDTGNNLVPMALQEAATLAEELGDVPGALQRLERAETATLGNSGFADAAARLALKRADVLLRAGLAAESVEARLRAQALYERDRPLGDAEARTAAAALAKALDKADRTADAKALRERYALAK